MKYFKNCKDLNEIKSLFKKLALQYHPDRTGYDSNEIMAEINSEYKKAIAFINKNVPNSDTNEELNLSDEYIALINSLVGLVGITIEVVGKWVWVTGETKQHKDIFKELKMFWAKNKQAWYWRPLEIKGSVARGKYDLDTIKVFFGSKNINQNVSSKKKITN